MATYKEKAIYEGNISNANSCRQEYLDSINNFVAKKLSDSFDKRDDFMQNIVYK